MSNSDFITYPIKKVKKSSRERAKTGNPELDKMNHLSALSQLKDSIDEAGILKDGVPKQTVNFFWREGLIVKRYFPNKHSHRLSISPLASSELSIPVPKSLKEQVMIYIQE